MPVVRKKKGFSNDWSFAAIFVIIALALLSTQNSFVQDTISGWGFEPSADMLEIEENLELTDAGKRILHATRPLLENDAAQFDDYCYNENTSENVSVLGCYANGNIYAYKIPHEKLVDENNVTVAHELLHAVWERMSSGEREKVKTLLEQVYAENQAWFDTQLDSYDETVRLEEIYTRAGTRLAQLPDVLEAHYAKYFKNRAQIVIYHQNYEAPFAELRAEIDELYVTIKTVRAENDARRVAYREGIKALNERIRIFNNCANTAGCFSESEFNRQHRALDLEKERLEASRIELNQKIDENNARIRKYEELRASLGELNEAVDSRIEIEHNE